MPPSKNVDQKRGKIFSIQRPQDLLDFVIEDERLSVGESSIIDMNRRQCYAAGFVFDCITNTCAKFVDSYHLHFKSKSTRAGVKLVKSLMYVTED